MKKSWSYIPFILLLIISCEKNDSIPQHIEYFSMTYRVYGIADKNQRIERNISYGIPHGQFPMEYRDTVYTGDFFITIDSFPVLGTKDRQIPVYLHWETREPSLTGMEIICEDTRFYMSEGSCPINRKTWSSYVKIE